MRKSVILALLTCLLSNLVYADPIEVSGTVSPGFTGLDYWPVYSTLEIGADGLVKINDNGLVELFSGVSFDLGGQLAIDGGKLKVNSGFSMSNVVWSEGTLEVSGELTNLAKNNLVDLNNRYLILNGLDGTDPNLLLQVTSRTEVGTIIDSFGQLDISNGIFNLKDYSLIIGSNSGGYGLVNVGSGGNIQVDNTNINDNREFNIVNGQANIDSGSLYFSSSKCYPTLTANHDGGYAILNIVNSGEVESTSMSISSIDGAIANLNISSGSECRFTEAGYHATSLSVSGTGESKVNVYDGGALYSKKTIIGIGDSNSGTIHVHNGGIWHSTPGDSGTEIGIGYSSGEGLVHIDGGDWISENGVSVGQTDGSGTVRVNNGGHWESIGDVSLKEDWSTTTHIIDVNDGTWDSRGNVIIATRSSNGASVNIADGIWTSYGDVAVGGTYASYNGTVNIHSGGIWISKKQVQIPSWFHCTGTVNIYSGGKWIAENGYSVAEYGSCLINLMGGIFQIGTSTNPINFSSSYLTSFDNGELIVYGQLNSSAETLTAGKTLHLFDYGLGNTITLDGGTLYHNGNQTITQGAEFNFISGVIGGTGNFDLADTILSAGKSISPGYPVGSQTISGISTISGGEYILEIGLDEGITVNDSLIISGETELSSLIVSLFSMQNDETRGSLSGFNHLTDYRWNDVIVAEGLSGDIHDMVLDISGVANEFHGIWSLEESENGHFDLLYTWKPNADINDDCFVDELDLREMVEQWLMSSSLDEGLVGYWSFDEGEGTTAYDESGNGNDGVLSGATWTEGISNGALHLGGYVTVPSSTSLQLDSQSGFTLSAWINPDNFGGIYGSTIITKGYSSSSYVLFVNNSGIVGLQFNWPNNTYYLYAPDPISSMEWTHILGLYDNHTGKTKLYINGSCVAEDEWLQNLNNNTQSLYFGANFPGADEFFYGTIDEISIYDRALSEQEIQYFYAHPSGLNNYLSHNLSNLTADLNYDNIVNLPDFAILASQWLSRVDGCVTCSESQGIDSYSDGVEMSDSPASVENNMLEHDSKVRLLVEQFDLALTEEVFVDISGNCDTYPCMYDEGTDFPDPQPSIAAGTSVNSYLVHFDPVDNDPAEPVVVDGTITFRNRVLGIITKQITLEATDPILKKDNVAYPPVGDDHDRKTNISGNDYVELVSPYEIQFHLEVPGVSYYDQMRVITEACE